MAWINACRPQGSVRNSVTVVFDGKEEFFGSQVDDETGVKIIFSKGQSADDLIKKIIEQSSDQRTWVVVSDDKDIKLYVRAMGASVMSVKEFMKSAAQQTRPDKYISLTDQARINRELERIWLKSQ